MWRPVRTADGSWTLAHPTHGATCHSLSGAWQQARERYAIPCRLRELAREHSLVRLLDVGTGLGLNVAAAAEAVGGSQASLEVVTLEHDDSVIRAALALADWPAEVEHHFGPVRAALERALAAKSRSTSWGSGHSLRLMLGDAGSSLGRLEASLAFDAVFFDPFAPRIEPALWSSDVLELVARLMAPHAVLSTYSSSLGVRVALARAGFAVGRGPRVGAKSSGTLASHAAVLPELDARTRRRLEKRAAASPLGKNPLPTG